MDCYCYSHLNSEQEQEITNNSNISIYIQLVVIYYYNKSLKVDTTVQYNFRPCQPCWKDISVQENTTVKDLQSHPKIIIKELWLSCRMKTNIFLTFNSSENMNFKRLMFLLFQSSPSYDTFENSIIKPPEKPSVTGNDFILDPLMC